MKAIACDRQPEPAADGGAPAAVPETASPAAAVAPEPAADGGAPAAVPETASPAAAVAPEPRQRPPVPPLEGPLARLSVNDVLRRAWEADLRISYSTVWRILQQDAIRPWFQKQWLFPRDPNLLEKAAPILDLYHGRWQGERLGPRDVVLCGDERTRLQALTRPYAGSATAPGREARYEFSHDRSRETLCYLGFLNVRTGRVFGLTEPANGIASFDRVLGHALRELGGEDAERVFLIVDNGSAHHPNTSPERMRRQHPQVTTVHLPVHSSWLNQMELYLSVLTRKALTPADFLDVNQLSRRIAAFQRYYNEWAEPFRWGYTKQDLERYLARLARHDPLYARHAAPDQPGGAGVSHPLTVQ